MDLETLVHSPFGSQKRRYGLGPMPHVFSVDSWSECHTPITLMGGNKPQVNQKSEYSKYHYTVHKIKILRKSKQKGVRANMDRGEVWKGEESNRRESAT
jgi:hypothetical protein